MTGSLFDIQHYAVHDGPGIRTLVFLKGCPLACAWCANPESRRPGRELRHLAPRCRACGRCQRACPGGAVSMTRSGPRFDRRRCDACAAGPCAGACPEGALLPVGEKWSVEDLVARVAKDRDFYRNSGGGVTFSGGEPFAQAPFLLAALRLCRRRGIRAAVETCGLAARADLLAAVPLADLFLFDVKVCDPALHRRLTGVDNRAILDNLSLLARRAPGKVVVRFPVVPGYTDGRRNVEALAGLMTRLGLARVDLCPYHPLGRGKYAELGLAEPPDPPQPRPAQLARLAAFFAARGIECGPA